MMQNLQHHARRLLAHSGRTRLFCSTTNGTLSSLQSRIETSLDQQIPTVLEQWRKQQGNQLNPSLVKGIMERLSDSNRFGKALAVSDWITEQKICNTLPEDFAARFHLIEKVLGLEEAEKFFKSIPKNQRGESIYTTLLDRYAKSGEKSMSKAESTFKEMRELGLLLRPSPYNSMMSLYVSFGNREKVDEILEEMEENNVQVDSVSVNNALRVYAAESDVMTMEKFLTDWEQVAKLEWLTTLEMAKAYLRDGSKEKAREMLCRTEISIDPKSYEELLRLYGEAGTKEDVYRIWKLYKETRVVANEGFQASIGSLLKLDDINGAEEIYNEWEESSGLDFDYRIPTMLVSGYTKNEMVEKAEKLMNKAINSRRLGRRVDALLEEWGKRGKQVKPWELRNVIKDLCDSKEFSKALEASSWIHKRNEFNLVSEDYATRLHLIENVLGLEEAERFFGSSIPENMKNYAVYSTLLTTYTRSAKTLDKAEATFEKMRELGFLSKVSPFNSMITLYSKLSKGSEVKNLMCEMKERNIKPDSVTLNNVLRVYADEGDIETMEKYKREWDDNYDKKTKLEMRTMDAMAKAYEKAGLTLKAIEMAGSSEEVYRLWDNCDKWKDEEHLILIRSLLRLDDVKGAEEAYEAWIPREIRFETRIPGLLISRYCEEEDYNEAKTWKAVKSVGKKKRINHFELFVAFCSLITTVSVVVGFVPGVIWFCGGDPIFVWSSLGIILYVLHVLTRT